MHNIVQYIDIQGLVLVIHRHRTAIKRTKLSKPTRLALQKNVIKAGLTVLDYGCGRGTDVLYLKDSGINAVGYDPIFYPDRTVLSQKYDVVLLNYVLNVIEDVTERSHVLVESFGLALHSLVVAVRIDSDKPKTLTKSFGDGVVTKKATFQKFFSPDYLIEYFDSVLSSDSFKLIKLDKGIFALIKS